MTNVDWREADRERADVALKSAHAAAEAIEQAVTSFGDYYRWADKSHAGAVNDLGVEVTRRLKQMQWLLRKISDLEAESAELSVAIMPSWELWDTPEFQGETQRRATDPEYQAKMKRHSTMGDEIELYAEAFYWIGGRARSVVKKLPELKSFEAEGIRNVRNKLIEHPEGNDSGVLWGGFGWGGPNGPVIKAARWSHQTDIWPDRGLYPNAVEFAAKLRLVIERAISKRESP